MDKLPLPGWLGVLATRLGEGVAVLWPRVPMGWGKAAWECRGMAPMDDSAAGSTQAWPGLWEVGRPLSSA